MPGLRAATSSSRLSSGHASKPWCHLLVVVSIPLTSPSFLPSTISKQNANLNQYWYSAHTIAGLASEVEEQASANGGDIAFLSTPSLYFSISPSTRQRARLLDFDTQWAWDPGFVAYDYKHPEALPVELKHRFAMVVIDPPFITKEVWKMYAKTTQYLLLRGSGDEDEKVSKRKILCTTVSENAGLLQALLGVKERRFQPSIPTLVYQFSSFSNYKSARLDAINPELM